jgi:hypothetical protein
MKKRTRRSPEERAEWWAQREARIQQLRELVARGRADLDARRAHEGARERPA